MAFKKMSGVALAELLEEQYRRFNNRQFIESDPISIPHSFRKKEDIEISGLLTATISWGNRNSILKNAHQLMELMDHAPFEFIMNHQPSDLGILHKFVHRTFNGKDCVFYIRALRNIYENGGLESAFYSPRGCDLKTRIIHFRKLFLETEHEKRSEKHLSDPGKKSSAKRICMFLRWMVRKDKSQVDFGIWDSIRPAELMMPLDVHTGTIGRKLGLLTRKQNDWNAVEELTSALRQFDPDDPVKYDLALFSMGVNKILG